MPPNSARNLGKKEDMAADEKRGAAKSLVMAGYTQEQTARILRLSKNTISNWSQADDWKGKRIRRNMIEENSVQKLMEIFEYQIECLHREAEEKKEAGEWIPFENGKFDALQKFQGLIKDDWRKYELHVKVIKSFLDFVQSQDVKLAKDILPLTDLYLNEKSRLSG